MKPLTPLLVVSVLAGSGASAADDTVDHRPAVATPADAMASSPSPVAPPGPAPRPRAHGSLFSDAQFQPLTSDKRRFQVGEVLTVMVYEDASASTSADTGAGRDSQVGLSAGLAGRSRNGTLAVNNDFTGTGRTQRAGRVLAQITVLVREVLPNGDLRVAGEQLLEINGEKQTIRAEGRVRPRDVTEQNIVLSSRMAEAKLAFVGDGVLGDMQRPRWWQRLLGLFGI